MEKVKKEPVTSFLVRLPSRLHKKLKIVCAEKEVSAQSLFQSYVEGLEVKDYASGK